MREGERIPLAGTKGPGVRAFAGRSTPFKQLLEQAARQRYCSWNVLIGRIAMERTPIIYAGAFLGFLSAAAYVADGAEIVVHDEQRGAAGYSAFASSVSSTANLTVISENVLGQEIIIPTPDREMIRAR